MFGPHVPTLTTAEIPSRLADGWMLLDVRTEEEWAEGHIDGAVHIPMDQIPERFEEVADQVLCICHLGGRSARVASYLNAHGKEAVNVDGGVESWVQEGRPLAQ
ncbi:MAG TPA: rhodanese-like domain-containing protein [Propionibacteriaceae bacterium]|nr:rhodanese-like domain-containing protein [Propionibacteriaceae bacterium]